MPSGHDITTYHDNGMYSYQVFGGCLQSELKFPDLLESDSESADWTLRVSRESVRERGGTLLGSGPDSFCRIDLYREPDHLLLYHSCTGSFEIRNDGSLILWSAASNAQAEAVRADVLGRVLGVAMHLQSIMTVHASAVALNGGAIAFLAPKHYGKSTLAMALTAAGARLVTDDMLPISSGAVPTVMPGVQSIRLMNDSAELLRPRQTSVSRGIDGKQIVQAQNPNQLLHERTPLSAIYLLYPVDSQAQGVAAVRTRLAAVPAAISLVGHMKVGTLLGTDAAESLIARAGEIAERVPVYRLQIARDIHRLNQVVSTIFRWHPTPMTLAS